MKNMLNVLVLRALCIKNLKVDDRSHFSPVPFVFSSSFDNRMNALGVLTAWRRDSVRSTKVLLFTRCSHSVRERYPPILISALGFGNGEKSRRIFQNPVPSLLMGDSTLAKSLGGGSN